MILASPEEEFQRPKRATNCPVKIPYLKLYRIRIQGIWACSADNISYFK